MDTIQRSTEHVGRTTYNTLLASALAAAKVYGKSC